MRLIWSILLMVLLAAPAGIAADDIPAVNALWSDFVQALRRGDYRRAHALFSAESRAALPYREFVLEYSPLAVAREMVLAKPDNLSTTVDGDWAELTYGGHRPGSGRPFKVAVGMVRNGGAWGLVAARNETPERIEAAARNVLKTASDIRGLPNSGELVREMLHRGGTEGVELNSYRFEMDGDILRAIPNRQGLRGFHVDAYGQVHAGIAPQTTGTTNRTGLDALSPMPEPPLPQAPPPLPPPPPTVDGLPEMREPSLPPGLVQTMPELSAPPLLYSRPESSPTVAEPQQFHLPDIIQ